MAVWVGDYVDRRYHSSGPFVGVSVAENRVL